jgi:streptogramin lyase
MVFVSLQGTNSLAAIDLRHMTLRWDERVGPAPAGVLWQDGKVLVADMGADYIAVVDPASGRVTRRVHTGKGAHQLFLSPDGRVIWVNNRVAGTVTTLDAHSLDILHRYAMPGGPDDLVFAPNGDVWFTLRFAHKLGVLNPTTGAVRTIEVGRSPHGIFMNPHAAVKPGA